MWILCGLLDHQSNAVVRKAYPHINLYTTAFYTQLRVHIELYPKPSNFSLVRYNVRCTDMPALKNENETFILTLALPGRCHVQETKALHDV